MRDFLAFAQFDTLWNRFLPVTPFGRAAKAEMKVCANPAELARIWDETERALALLAALEDDGVRLSQIQHHLKRLPRFCEDSKPGYDEVEIFQFKKFLHNFKGLSERIDAESRACFGLAYASDALERLLDQGRQSAESFYVADAYSAELAELRSEIRATDTALQALQARRSAEIQTRWGFDFGSRAFLVVPKEAVGPPEAATDLLRVEPFDESKVAIRIQASAEDFRLQERRSTLLTRERAAEDRVLATLSEAIRSELANLRTYQAAITRFDLAFARARLALDHRLVRPTLGADVIAITEGRFLPCEEVCEGLGTEYIALSARFATAAVIFGSNMGGKTVVLKSLAFLQLCTQMGLFVPAASFHTRLFEHFHYLGEGQATQAAQGLSGFGLEIRRFLEAAQHFNAPTLVLFDEFARTTNSQEAEAILSAVLESIAAHPGVMALFSTHFRGVRRLPGVTYLRMKGLNREALNLDLTLGTIPAEPCDASLEARIRQIDQHMEYHLVPDTGGPGPSDAIAVAGLLGLDPAITRRAECFFEPGPGSQEESR